VTDGTGGGGTADWAQAAAQAGGWDFISDSTTGAGIPRPPRWRRRDDTAAVIALVDGFVPTGRAFRPNVNVVVEKPHQILTDLDVFTVRAIQNMQGGMTDLHLIDVQPAEIGGRPGRHVTSAYRSGIYSLALEQWWTVVGDTATTLSATCAVEDYARLAETFDVVAAGLKPAIGHAPAGQPSAGQPSAGQSVNGQSAAGQPPS
jgi:hypothetical protein